MKHGVHIRASGLGVADWRHFLERPRQPDRTGPAGSRAGDEVITSIVSRVMLPRYSHVRMEAKRRALDEIAARDRAAGGKGKDAERREQVAIGLATGCDSVKRHTAMADTLGRKTTVRTAWPRGPNHVE